jgi:hypothetical protein
MLRVTGSTSRHCHQPRLSIKAQERNCKSPAVAKETTEETSVTRETTAEPGRSARSERDHDDPDHEDDQDGHEQQLDASMLGRGRHPLIIYRGCNANHHRHLCHLLELMGSWGPWIHAVHGFMGFMGSWGSWGSWVHGVHGVQGSTVQGSYARNSRILNPEARNLEP